MVARAAFMAKMARLQDEPLSDLGGNLSGLLVGDGAGPKVFKFEHLKRRGLAIGDANARINAPASLSA
jgi:hypothetical protein